MARIYLIEKSDRDFMSFRWTVSCPYDRTVGKKFFYFKSTAIAWARKQQKLENAPAKSSSFILNENGNLIQGHEPF